MFTPWPSAANSCDFSESLVMSFSLVTRHRHAQLMNGSLISGAGRAVQIFLTFAYKGRHSLANQAAPV
jgi:hypothetical protein